MKKVLMTFVFVAGALGAWPWSTKVAPVDLPIPVDEVSSILKPKQLVLLQREEAIAPDTYGKRSSKARTRSPFAPDVAPDESSLSPARKAVGAHRGKSKTGKSRLQVTCPVGDLSDTSLTPRRASLHSPKHRSSRSPRH
jgi:hypothetical protein